MFKSIISITILVVCVQAKPGFAPFAYTHQVPIPCDPPFVGHPDPVIIDAYNAHFLPPTPAHFYTPTFKTHITPGFYSSPLTKVSFGTPLFARAAPAFPHAPTHFVPRAAPVVVKAAPFGYSPLPSLW